MQIGISMGFHNILLIDNEVSNLKALERTLRLEYDIFSATNAEDALTIMEQNDVALIIAEYRMPDLTSVEFLEKALEKYPDTIFIVLTEYSDDNSLIDTIDAKHIYAYITKPWEPEEVKSIVSDGIEAYEVIRASKEPHIRGLLHGGIISMEQLGAALRVQKFKEKPIGKILVERGMISRNQLNTAVELQKSMHERLGEVLVKLGTISRRGLKTALILQRHERKKLAEIFVDLGYADEESIYSHYALQLGMPRMALSQFSREPWLAELIPPELACKYTIVPLDAVGRVLTVAALEPLSEEARSEIESKTKYKVMSVYASPQDMQTGLDTYCDILQKQKRTEEVMGAKTIEIGLPGVIRFHANDDAIECVINDITEDCEDAMVAASDPRVCIKDDVDLDILVPLEHSPVKCSGRIIWCSEADEELLRHDREYLARISVTDISRIDRRRLELLVAQRKVFSGGN